MNTKQLLSGIAESFAHEVDVPGWSQFNFCMDRQLSRVWPDGPDNRVKALDAEKRGEIMHINAKRWLESGNQDLQHSMWLDYLVMSSIAQVCSVLKVLRILHLAWMSCLDLHSLNSLFWYGRPNLLWADQTSLVAWASGQTCGCPHNTHTTRDKFTAGGQPISMMDS